jgi:hypothetical protein
MTDGFAKSMVLHSLPPSYKDFVESFMKRNEAVNFHKLLGRIRTRNVEPAQDEIIDLEGIFDIQCYKCFIHLCSFEYMILTLVL